MAGLCTDKRIIELCEKEAMITPFERQQVRNVNGKSVISYGVSSCGYDIRVSNKFSIFTNVHNTLVDPKNFDTKSLVEISTDEHIIIPPNSFALALSIERFKIPRNVLTICLGKSTYARCGIIINVTPFEPGWEGHAVIEISNTTPAPVKVYHTNEGLAQLIFFESEEACETSYADRKGKYQNQTGIHITLPKL